MRYGIAVAVLFLALLIALVVSALAFAPKTSQAAEGELYVDSFTSPTGWGITGFNTSSGNYAFCIDPPAYPPIGTTMTSWAWTGEAQGIIPDPHALAYLMWAVANNARGFETPVESTVIATWLLCPPAEVDLDSGDYTNGRQSANIYEGYGTRVSRNDRDKILAVADEAREHAGQPGPWDRASRVWYSPDSTLQNIVEMLPNGTVTLSKHSAAAGVTDGNALYSLEGAHYTVWRDPACTEYAGFDFYTDANGYAELRDAVPSGTYYVREEGAPRGYALDAAVYTVEVDSGDESHLDTYEQPLYDSAKMWVQKVDADMGEPVAEGGGSLAGAEFALRYYENEVGDVSGTPAREWILKTDEGGAALLDDAHKVSGPDFYRTEQGEPCIPIGTATIQETKPPEGYLLEGQGDPNAPGFASPVHTHVITGDGSGFAVTQRNVDTVPESPVRGGVSLIKQDAESGDTPQGDADFANISFDVVNANDRPVLVGGRQYQPGDAISGCLVTDASGCASTPDDLLPYGRYIVEEAETNESMRKTAGPQDVTVSENGVVVKLKAKNGRESPFRNEVVRGGVKVGKIDGESRLHEPQGSASLEGTVFTITNVSAHPVKVNGTFYAPGKVVYELSTGKDGTAVTEVDALPYGSYEIREKTPPRGYLPGAEWVKEFKIRADKVIVDKSEPVDSAANQARRGDVEGVKAGAGTMARLGGVPFVIESLTTGEWHVVVTDANGEFDTTSGNWSHGRSTNASDAAVTKVGDGNWTVTDESKLKADAGTWFAGHADFSKNPTPKDGLGAMPFDSYQITELRCKANEGHTLVSFPITVSRDKKVINTGTIDDEQAPEIGSFAHAEGTESQEIEAEDVVHFTDTVYYDRLTPNADYRFTGTLHVRNEDGSDGGALTDSEGNAVTSTTERRVRAPSDKVDVAFEFDAGLLDGRDLVVFERVTRAEDGSDVCGHEDIANEDQTVRVRPRVRTAATDPSDGDHEVSSVGTVTVRDAVSYTALQPGREYTVTGTLVDKATGETLAGGEGSPITATKTFVPESPSGVTHIEFTVDGSQLAGRTVVAFESVSADGVEVASHADVDDIDQTITFPKIGTTATVDGSKECETTASLTVTDTVAYENLVPGTEYRLRGTLVDKLTGEPLKPGGGPVVASEVTFTPEEESGTVPLDLTFDSAGFGDAELVVFETLARGEVAVAEHADVDDEGQTVRVRPRIATTATDAVDGDHEVPSAGTATIRDEVRYEGLRPGREYSVTGTLHERLPNGSDGGEIRDTEGNAIAANTTFTPKTGSGSVTLEFKLDGALLAGRTVVAFESVSAGDVEVATHADISDQDQTVTSPRLRTTAKVDSIDAEEKGPESLTVVDTVRYENLVPNAEYTIEGRLMDKATGQPVGREGERVTAKTTFRPTQPNGTVDVQFAYDRSLTIGRTTVVFESLSNAGRKVAEHADIEDEDQSFDTPAIYTTASDKSDGDKQVNALGSVSIQDSVLHRGLERGERYTLRGRLMDKATGAPLCTPDGSEITAERSFTAESPDGIVPMEFECDGRLLSGKTIVVFEELMRDDKIMARHADIDDMAQSVEGARIRTSAKDGADGDKNVSPDGDQTVVDTVSYSGLTPGKTYALSATLLGKAPRDSGLKDAARTDAEASNHPNALAGGTATFCPDSGDGTVEVEIACRPEAFAGQDLVVFESLTTEVDEGGKTVTQTVADHADPDDKDQTVHVDAPARTMPQTGVDMAALAATVAGLGAAGATAARLLGRRLCRRRHR